MIQNFGGRSFWQNWGITIDTPKFYFQKAEVFNIASQLNCA